MASFIAYAMSGVTLLFAIAALTVSVAGRVKFTTDQHRRLIGGFLFFGFLAWLFAYLGGI